MGLPVVETDALYYPPRGMPIASIPGFQPYPAKIVSVGPTGLCHLLVRDPSGAQSPSIWHKEAVKWVDNGDSAPANGGFVAPQGWTPAWTSDPSPYPQPPLYSNQWLDRIANVDTPDAQTWNQNVSSGT
jgi:hypothetical protein